MPKTHSKLHMYNMVKINTIVFEIVEGRGAFKAPPRVVSCLKYPGSDRVKQQQQQQQQQQQHNQILLFTQHNSRLVAIILLLVHS